MIKRVFLIGTIVCSCLLISHATVWRLNNIPGVDADFKIDLQDAIDNISSGDTIYVEQSPFSYGVATIAKKVILFGGGYWLSENDSTQASEEVSKIDKLNFYTGSEGSILSGCYLYSAAQIYDFRLIEISADNITLERNYIFLDQLGGYSGNSVYINGNRNDIIIQQNWILQTDNNAKQACIYINGDPGNLKIQNNFIRSYYYPYNDGICIYSTTNSISGDFAIINNVLLGDIHTHSSLLINNILITGSYYNGYGGIAANNLCNETQFPDINNNQLNIDMSAIFVDHDLYIDNGYILAPGSSAINAGFNGGDCGLFGYGYGGNPYVLSGIPNIPTIFEVNFNSMVFPADTTNLQIDVKAKSNN